MIIITFPSSWDASTTSPMQLGILGGVHDHRWRVLVDVIRLVLDAPHMRQHVGPARIFETAGLARGTLV